MTARRMVMRRAASALAKGFRRMDKPRGPSSGNMKKGAEAPFSFGWYAAPFYWSRLSTPWGAALAWASMAVAAWERMLFLV